MELEKYRNDGWGISIEGFECLLDALRRKAESSADEIRVLEFGSGTSTQFFLDAHLRGVARLHVDSFDNDIAYAFKPTKESEGIVSLLIRPLVDCAPLQYEKQFRDHSFDRALMTRKTSPVHTRQSNTFYDLEQGDLNGIYDIVVVDGPHGNGRNFAFLHILGHVKPGTVVFIDDYNHYDFEQRFISLFKAREIARKTLPNDRFVVFEVVE